VPDQGETLVSVGQVTAKNAQDPGGTKTANDLRIEFEIPVEVTAINGKDPNATPPPQDAPTVQGGGAGGAPPSGKVTITWPPPLPVIPVDGKVTINVKTKDDKAIKGKYRFTFDNVYLRNKWEEFELGKDKEPEEPTH
jgi:hypothetical protein